MPQDSRREDDVERLPAQRTGGTNIHVQLKGPFGCLFGAIILAVGLALLVIAAFAGLVAVAVAFWIGAAVLAVGLVMALLRGR